MISFHKAKVIGPEELKELMDVETEFNADETTKQKQNPSMNRLFYIEAKNIKGTTSIYPCFFAGYAYDREPKAPEAESPKLLFDVYIVQCLNGKFGMLEVIIKQDEFGNGKRVWDLPPTKEAREMTEWVPPVEAGVQ